MGDTFDIDYVAHEIGHQVGDNHTYSFNEGTGVCVEPDRDLQLWAMPELQVTIQMFSNILMLISIL